MAHTLFVSDLHLDRARPHIAAAFCSFLQDITDTDALYILGDLFEFWIGDDDPNIGLQSVVDSLRALSTAGVPVYFIHGNRDFLIGQGVRGLYALQDPAGGNRGGPVRHSDANHAWRHAVYG